VRIPDQAKRQARLFRYGLIPPWADDPCIRNGLINARAETMVTKPAFRRAFKEQRSLLLIGFYERQRQEGRKQPFSFRRRDGRPYDFAGLWEHWERSDASPLDTCTILTTIANDREKTRRHLERS
jgi:putative SOS response-associated peptidase YedK